MAEGEGLCIKRTLAYVTCCGLRFRPFSFLPYCQLQLRWSNNNYNNKKLFICLLLIYSFLDCGCYNTLGVVLFPGSFSSGERQRERFVSEIRSWQIRAFSFLNIDTFYCLLSLFSFRFSFILFHGGSSIPLLRLSDPSFSSLRFLFGSFCF